ncbi:ATP-binding protein [Lachnospiraceae bacterium NSJ-143]|nr:ATP-binding protein [Lachnospiraceae bacterium NSJ-143]
MPDRSEIYKQVLRYYDALKTQAQAQLRQKKEELYARCPRIRDIDSEISLLGISAAKWAVESGESSAARLIELKEKMEGLKAEKLSIMRQAGFEEDYLKPSYRCEKCSDTGFIGSQQCSCFTQKLVDMAYSSSNMREITAEENFDNFDIDFYSPNRAKNEPVSPRENMQMILSVCLEFTKSFGKRKENLLFYGSPGLGKTFLCSCIAREILDKGYTVLYVTAAQLFKALEKERFNRNDEETEQVRFSDDLQSVDLLIVDDLGTEFNTVLTASELFDILNTRLINKKPVIISTNLSLDDIQRQYSDRITSRIIGEYKALEFFGDDIRVVKKYMGK